ncbi:MAG: cold shock domain-containing protein [Pirellulaceae bacterium]|nr:cold shock domain-containing protein [Pirellulaceae bacterium]
MRIGEVVKVVTEKKFGFIRSGDLREDIFFHFSIVDAQGRRDLMEGDEVEYEIDEFAWVDRKELKATLVRMSPRPLTMRLKASDAPQLQSQHHPRARQKRPTWRNKDKAAGEVTPDDGNS